MISPYRNWIVVIAAVAILLLGAWPLPERIKQAGLRQSQIAQSIQHISANREKLPELKELVERRQQQAEMAVGISPGRMVEFRERVHALAREHGCRVEQVNEGRTNRQPWNESLNPLLTSTPVVKDKPKYEVVTSTIGFTLVGPLKSVNNLLHELQKLDSFFVPLKLNLQNTQENDVKAELEMMSLELSMVTGTK